MDCCCGHSASQLVPTPTTAGTQPRSHCHRHQSFPLGTGCLVTHLQLQLLNQLLRAERPWQVILVPQHQQRNAIQAGLGKQRMQLLGSNLQDTKGHRVTTRSSTWRLCWTGCMWCSSCNFPLVHGGRLAFCCSDHSALTQVAVQCGALQCDPAGGAQQTHHTAHLDCFMVCCIHHVHNCLHASAVSLP